MADGLAFDAERVVGLPFPPFVGLRLYNAEWRPPGCDESEDTVEEVGHDLATGRVYCYLPIDDFRPESSGSADWTEEDVRNYYRDWALTRDEPRRAQGGHEWS